MCPKLHRPMLSIGKLACAFVAFATCLSHCNADQPISFELDVQPIMTSAGCNAGAYHGKQRGQNGFQFSLLGFDSDFDYDQITQQARGRRLFPASPEKSLLLQKKRPLSCRMVADSVLRLALCNTICCLTGFNKGLFDLCLAKRNWRASSWCKPIFRCGRVSCKSCR